MIVIVCESVGNPVGKGAFSPQGFQKGCFLGVVNSLPKKQQIVGSSKRKEFADDNFRFDENGRKHFW